MNFIQKIPLKIFNLFYPLKIYGKENVPKGKAVLVSNHFHALDCGFLASVYNKDLFFLSKKEIYKNKLISKIIKSYGGIPIDRENPDMKSLMSAIRVLKDGHKLAIFAEGTRNKTGTDELQPIKGGAIVFAVKSKSPIVPIMILKKLKFFRKSYLIVGEPFELSEFYDKKYSDDDLIKMEEMVAEKMREQHAKLKQILQSKKDKKKNDCSKR